MENGEVDAHARLSLVSFMEVPSTAEYSYRSERREPHIVEQLQ